MLHDCLSSSSALLLYLSAAYDFDMLLQSSVAFGLWAVTTTAAQYPCGTSPSSHALRAVTENLKGDLEIRGGRNHVTIKTYVHVIGASDKEEDGYITVSPVIEQTSNARSYYFYRMKL